jgi:hypothetical protein
MKYNRPKLKIQYLEWEFLTVLDFYKRHLNSTKTAPKSTIIKSLPGQWKKMTKWWSEEKSIMQKKVEQLVEDAKIAIQEKLKQDAQEQLNVDVQELIKQKKALFILINKKIVHLAKHNPQDILARELDILLNMVKRELGEPMTLTKNHTIEEKAFIPSEDELDE